MSDLARLHRAIRDLHGLETEHVRSEPVHEPFRGGPVWDGVVEVFALVGHPTANLAYAWAHEADTGNRRYTKVLELPPIQTAAGAVRAAIAAEADSHRKPGNSR